MCMDMGIDMCIDMCACTCVDVEGRRSVCRYGRQAMSPASRLHEEDPGMITRACTQPACMHAPMCTACTRARTHTQTPHGTLVGGTFVAHMFFGSAGILLRVSACCDQGAGTHAHMHAGTHAHMHACTHTFCVRMCAYTHTHSSGVSASMCCSLQRPNGV